jgi:hypothetical protein
MCGVITMENWKQVKCFDSYFVSDLGRVKKIYENSKIKMLKQRFSKDGYLRVALSKNRIVKEWRVSRIVAEHFIENEKNLDTVNHKDGNKTNNKVENLEWMTRSEQMYHAYSLGLKKPKTGEKNVNSKISNAESEEIRIKYKQGNMSYLRLSEIYGISTASIQRIVTNKSFIK